MVRCATHGALHEDGAPLLLEDDAYEVLLLLEDGWLMRNKRSPAARLTSSAFGTPLQELIHGNR